jgi:lipopolysaccharide export system protein LptA
MIGRRAACLLAALLGASALARAQGIDLSNGGPVQVNAAGGIDWQQNQQLVIAHGDARATRGDVTVTAAELIAHYRKKAAQPGAAAAKPAATDGAPDDTGSSEVYRLDAINDVHIFTPTDQAFGDRAAYDMDQSVLVLTGKHLKLITPQDVLTSTDSMEYYPNQHMSVARGHAVVVTSDARRIAADVLVGYSTPGQGNPAPASPPKVTQAAATPGKPPADPLLASGKLEKVEAFGHVDVRTPTETVMGDRGVYVPDTGKAHIIGHVRITRGENQLNGNEAEVNMKTGVATMLPGGADRVHGLIVPNDAQTQTGGAAKPPAKPLAKAPSKPASKQAATTAQAT